MGRKVMAQFSTISIAYAVGDNVSWLVLSISVLLLSKANIF